METDKCYVAEWEECEPVTIDMNYTVPMSNCTETGVEEYETCEKEDKQIMTSQQTCEVKSEPSCKPKVVKKVIRYTWENFHKLIQKAY